MNINDVKAAINKAQGTNITTLMMARQMNQNPVAGGEPVKSEWLSHWDNDSRVRVTMHQDVFGNLKSEPTRNDLAIKYEVVAAAAERAAYSRYVVIIPTSVEGTF